MNWDTVDEMTAETDAESSDDEDVDGSTSELETAADLSGRRIAIVGKLGGMNRREAANLLRSYHAVVLESATNLDPVAHAIDWIVIGAEESPLAEADLITPSMRDAVAKGTLRIVHETELWHLLGLIDVEASARKLYTPAMLAHLLGVSVRVIRRWHRRGLIQPVRTLHRLPYFDFQEVATARRLAQWVASGASPEAIERRLVAVIQHAPDLRRPLDQLSILVEGRQVLLRHGEGLLEPGGQLRFDFDALHDTSSPAAESIDAILSFPIREDGSVNAFPPQARGEPDDELLAAAYAAEDEDDLELAVDCYHAILARDGSRPDIHFQIGELLYRMNEPIAARERYYAAIEVDPDHVEARASLAGVLAETGQTELAISAYRGALSLHDGYSDVHYNLARLLDDSDRPVEAEHHWRRFLALAPRSHWADEARCRLQTDSPTGPLDDDSDG